MERQGWITVIAVKAVEDPLFFSASAANSSGDNGGRPLPGMRLVQQATQMKSNAESAQQPRWWLDGRINTAVA